MSLATLLHISDLHFGDIDPDTGDAIEPTFVGLNEVFDGLLGHSYYSLKRVSRFWANLRKNEEPLLVVTGDLTTVGKIEQFQTASTFLGATVDLSNTIPNILPVGLITAGWRDRAIPGNHDHWPGSCQPPNFMFGAPPKHLWDTFLKLYPVISPPINLSSGHSLRFLMINSDAGISYNGPSRFFARGSFTDQLDELRKGLDVPEEGEIRVLCLHHSPAVLDYSLGITGLSRGALSDFIIDHNIAVLLTGHKHTPPLVKRFPASHLISREFLEARCGTTTQQSTFSYETRTLTGKRSQRPGQLPNALLVHRLSEQDGAIWWETECYFELSTGFKERSTIGTNVIRGITVETPFKVWPLNT
jgi:hypothetical protein